MALSRFTHGLIEGAGAFVLAYPGRELAKATRYGGGHSGREVGKFAHTGVTALPGRRVAAPLVAGSAGDETVLTDVRFRFEVVRR